KDIGVRAKLSILSVFILIASLVSLSAAQVCNIKVVTDASPDYYDIDSMIHSITGKWPTAAEKCWAMFYFNHIARRQTSPMMIHGLECTDPIRQFNDYGYTMCSTIAGINCSIWDAMGYNVKFWDITLHTVPEVEYDGRWHMYDNSMSALYTLCDDRTIAGVEDIGKDGGCTVSKGRIEPGHIARYHCLNAGSNNGFLTGADCPRDLAQEYRCFKPSGLKYRYYYNNWDRGHRYILNLRDNEVYTRYYRSLGTSNDYYVSNNGKDPEETNTRYKIRGNGIRTYKPVVTADSLPNSAHSISNCKMIKPDAVVPDKVGEIGEVVFQIEGTNVITRLLIKAVLLRKTSADINLLSISTTNGLTWKQVWNNDKTGEIPISLNLVNEVNGSYEVLVKVTLKANTSPSDACLKNIEFETITMLNSKTQPKLLLGKNTVYVGIGDQTGSVVVWPDLQGKNYLPYIFEQENIVSEEKHKGYQGVMHAIEPKKQAYVVFRIDAPGDITRINYGGRFYNRAPESRIELFHSFDFGKTWNNAYSLTRTKPPWDAIHYEIIDNVPTATRSILFKYLLNSSQAGTSACSIYSVRMEVNHKPKNAAFKPLEVTFDWSELQQDYSLVERSHTELIQTVPYKYNINIGGADHPIVNSLRIKLKGDLPNIRYGYSDGKDVGGEKYVSRWVTYGKNLAEGKDYTVSVPSNNKWDAGDPDGNKLTDGIVGPPYAGGIGPRYALCWDKDTNPEITVDLGSPQSCGAFRIHLSAGWPWWDALKGQVQDKVELLTSTDGKNYTSRGYFPINLRRKDLPVNHMMPDDETATGFNYELVPPEPVRARYVRFKITPERTLTVSEVQVLDFIRTKPFDLRIALPDDKHAGTVASKNPAPSL
nr:discoidin domain-containing protein [Phycisphaerae bacterium]NIR67763.1 discoidin domain-containing protein [candidate division Zixibacteria bacterium]NIP51756.1 discoidin domain-containing protein [Phycisphaerae bacterium]NIS53453.1 discoidin domain-containing protein [Phycisphaerae bacterium]NIU10935.1 discoidin domain-containing protein [Phycisphaerae bacterium]